VLADRCARRLAARSAAGHHGPGAEPDDTADLEDERAALAAARDALAAA
jgi:hypothetical protein